MSRFAKSLTIQLSLCIASVIGMGYVWSMFLNKGSNRVPTICSELAQMDELGLDVSLSEFHLVGELISISPHSNLLVECQPVSAKPIADNEVVDASNLMFLVNRSAPSMQPAIASGAFDGYACFNDHENDRFGEELCTEISKRYPNLDLDSVLVVSMSKPTPVWAWLVLGFFTIWSIASIPGTYFYLKRTHKKLEEWRARIAEDRAPVYKKHKYAMRLVNFNDGTFENTLSSRQVDLTFDVPQPKRTSRPRIKKGAYQIAVIFTFTLIGGLLQYAASFSEWGGILGQIQNFLTVGFVLIGFEVAGTIVAYETTAKQEEPLDRKKAVYREYGFHAYHHAVLMELGFKEIGDFQLVGGPTNLCRTIYFSANRNLVVEIGVESSRSFFTLETMLNNGKFLETHSLLKPAKVTIDLTSHFLRRSASHEDIVRALEEHDQFISEMNYGGTVMEAEFSAEKLERFLLWPTTNNASKV